MRQKIDLFPHEGLFITATHTGAGKTLTSAIFTQALRADYWKPIQAGDLENTDSDVVRSLLQSGKSEIHEEAYRLKAAMSPHAAAAQEHILIELSNIRRPKTKNKLIVEGAGGVMVPLNDDEMMIDLMAQLKYPVVVVSHNYLGSINHTLLTLEALSTRNIQMAGIVFNGKRNEESERLIEARSRLPVLLRIPQLKAATPHEVALLAERLVEDLKSRKGE